MSNTTMQPEFCSGCGFKHLWWISCYGAAKNRIEFPDGNDSDQDRIDAYVSFLAPLTDAQRLSVFNSFCKHCGAPDPSCQCWNDE